MAIQRVTQDRFFFSGADFEGFHCNIGDVANITLAQILGLQGWASSDTAQIQFLNTRNTVPDDETALFLRDADEGENPQITKPLSQKQIDDAFKFGGQLKMVHRVDSSSQYASTLTDGSVAFTWGIDADKDPRKPDVYTFPTNNETVRTVGIFDTPITVLENGGEIELEVRGLQTSSDTDVFLGGGSGSSYLGFNNIEKFTLKVAGSNNDDSVGGGIGTTKVKVRRSGTDVFFTFDDGTEETAVPKGSNAPFLIETIGAAGNAFITNRGWGFLNLRIKEHATAPDRYWSLSNDGSGTWLETGGSNTISIMNYTDTLWRRWGTRHRMLLAAGTDANVNVPQAGTQLGWALYNQSGKEVEHTATFDSTYHDLTVVIKKSPDGINWGDAQMRVDGVNIGAPITNWWRTDSSSIATHLGAQSGASGASWRYSYHKIFQLQVNEDFREYEIGKTAFDLNSVGGIIGLDNVNLNITADAFNARACSIVEINLLENTTIIFNCLDGQLRHKSTDAPLTTITFNPTNTEQLRKFYITKDSDVGVTPQRYLITELKEG
ncbi:MAG: hypothetical protein COA84_14275 [Robiginitomaculum sp.]|nr:MAG: hypothetical protein COA84_14275 [Robiginitomaculum sp.]